MNNNGYLLADSIDVIEEILLSGGEFKMYPRGRSMLPFIVEDKDSVVLIRQQGPLKKNDIAFYLRDNGQFVLHRVVRRESDGTYSMCGDNQTVIEKGIRENQVIGVVSKLYKEEKLFDDRAFSYRLYLFFWCFIPFRKVLRFPKRCFDKIHREMKKIFKIG